MRTIWIPPRGTCWSVRAATPQPEIRVSSETVMSRSQNSLPSSRPTPPRPSSGPTQAPSAAPNRVSCPSGKSSVALPQAGTGPAPPLGWVAPPASVGDTRTCEGHGRVWDGSQAGHRPPNTPVTVPRMAAGAARAARRLDDRQGFHFTTAAPLLHEGGDEPSSLPYTLLQVPPLASSPHPP